MSEMEMPCPCQQCGEWFDLNDGVGSDKWYPNTVICASCGRLEEKEIEIDDEIEELKESISEAEANKSYAEKRLLEIVMAEPWRNVDNEIGFDESFLKDNPATATKQ